MVEAAGSIILKASRIALLVRPYTLFLSAVKAALITAPFDVRLQSLHCLSTFVVGHNVRESTWTERRHCNTGLTKCPVLNAI